MATSTALGVLEIDRSIAALMRARPLAVDGADTATPGITLVVFAGLTVAALGLYTAVMFAWHGRRRRGRRYGRRGKSLAGRAGVKTAAGKSRARASAAVTRPGISARQRRRAPLEQVVLHVADEASSGAPVVFTLGRVCCLGLELVHLGAENGVFG